MVDPLGLNRLKNYYRMISPSPIYSLKDKVTFALVFTEQWGDSLIGMAILSGAGVFLVFEEIWRNGFLGTGFSTFLSLLPWIVVGIVAGIALGRWTTRYELIRVKKNIKTWSIKPRGLTLFECVPWCGFLIGLAICFGSGIIVRGILDIIHLIKNPSLIWISTGTAVFVHGIHHMLWWNDKQRVELLTLLCRSLGLDKSKNP